MNGRPVWLASISIRNRYGQLMPSSSWAQNPTTLDRLERVLRRQLWGVGDNTAERFFRMPITACYHRALSTDEDRRVRRMRPLQDASRSPSMRRQDSRPLSSASIEMLPPNGQKSCERGGALLRAEIPLGRAYPARDDAVWD